MATIKGTLGADKLEGTDQNDFIDGVGGHGDTLLGGLGDDTIVYRGGVGAILDGGAGENDTLIVLGAIERVVDLNGIGPAVQLDIDINGDNLVDGNDTIASQIEAIGRAINFENIDLSKAEIDARTDPTLRGGFDVRGTDGANRIVGSRVGDFIDGRGGKDVILAGAGDDDVVFDPEDATIDGGTGQHDELRFLSNAAAVDGKIVVDLIKIDQVEGGGITRGFEDIFTNGSVSVAMTVRGSNAANVIDIGTGDDVIDGRGGNDALFGFDGNDSVLGGAGGDLIEGQEGDDDLDGGVGNDTIRGQGGKDVIKGGLGLDRVEGIDFDDKTVDGGGGSDTLVLSDLRSTNGGTLRIDLSKTDNQFVEIPVDLAEKVVVTGFEAIDGSGMQEGFEARGSLAANTLIGGSKNDTLIAEGSLDVLEGGDGDDLITANRSARRIDGGDGKNDTLILTVGTKIDLARDLNQFEGRTSRSAPGVMTGIEHVDASGAIKLGVSLKGQLGDNKLTGSRFNDTIDGIAGKDELIGGDGDDRVTYNDKASFIHGGDGVTDTAKKDTLVVIDGGNGNGRLKFDLSAVDQDDGGTAVPAGTNVTGFENIDATKSLKRIDVTLSSDANEIRGSGDSDVVRGTGAGDVVLANDGNDFVDYSIEAKLIDGGKGLGDELEFLDDSGAVNGKIVIDLLKADQVLGGGLTRGFENVDFDQTVTASANVLGTNGANLIVTGKGDDVIDGRKGDDEINAGEGTDTVRGGAGNDTISGEGGADVLDGGDGDDLLFLFGDDTAKGGRGADVFDFNFANAGAATILDFKVVEGDRIDVSGIDANVDVGGNGKFTFIYDQAFSAAGQLRATVENGELVIQGNTDADLTTVEFSFTLVGVLSIRESDFVL